MEYVLLLCILIIGNCLIDKIIKKYPCTVPQVIWKELKLTHCKKRTFFISFIIFLGLISIQFFPTLFELLPLSFYYLLFLSSILFLMKTDWEKEIIPDFITFPLLILGLAIPHLTIFSILSPFDAIFGAIIGYALPSLLGFIFYKWKKDSLGAGDVKLLSMIGAWCGVIGLSYILILGSVFFIIYSLKTKKRALPLAPFLGLACYFFMAFHPIFFSYINN
ncbi:MAG: prepilin peptidase [Alphaproteobacteria bacterium]